MSFKQKILRDLYAFLWVVVMFFSVGFGFSYLPVFGAVSIVVLEFITFRYSYKKIFGEEFISQPVSGNLIKEMEANDRVTAAEGSFLAAGYDHGDARGLAEGRR